VRSFGIDFGTTNSAVAVADHDGAVTLAHFPEKGGLSETFRSILYFERAEGELARDRVAVGGEEAIERYLASNGSGRLVQSLKSYLADRTFSSTNLFGRTTTLVELLGFLGRALRVRAEAELGPIDGRVVVGRPVHFSSGRGDDDDAFAVERLRTALAAAGFRDVVFEYEPVAAAYYYESRLDHDETVLVADFGGGTSDFSLVEVGPTKRRGARRILASEGVGLAGDALDAKIVDHVVAPALGKGTLYRSMMGKELDVPVWLYARLRKWHHLSFLKSKRTMELLEEIVHSADEPDKIRGLLHLVDHDLGYRLARTVERTKVELSARVSARFVFESAPVHLEAEITRADFESWIAGEVSAMEGCVDRVLAHAGLGPEDVDRVFMTGGTSFVPVVRAIFESRFGAGKISAGGEMISVASGLALRGRDLE
jgi:hypothetical chaperone protein